MVPHRVVEYLGRTADAVEEDKRLEKERLVEEGWNLNASNDVESSVEIFRKKFMNRRRLGMQQVREKYQQMKEDANSEGAEIKNTNTGVTEVLDEVGFSLNTSVDPTRVAQGEYIVHKKYGVGQFMGLKDLPAPDGSGKKVTYMFLKYADGTAKLKASLASRLLYRYRNPGTESAKNKVKLSQLSNTADWEMRRAKGQKSVRKLVINVMDIYLHRMQQSRQPYPDPAPDNLKAFVGDNIYIRAPMHSRSDKLHNFLGTCRMGTPLRGCTAPSICTKRIRVTSRGMVCKMVNPGISYHFY
jgi:hypothetical protein